MAVSDGQTLIIKVNLSHHIGVCSELLVSSIDLVLSGGTQQSLESRGILHYGRHDPRVRLVQGAGRLDGQTYFVYNQDASGASILCLTIGNMKSMDLTYLVPSC